MFSHQIIPLCVSRVSLKCQCVYGLYSFAWTEQMRPLHASYLKTGSQDEVRPLQAPLTISLCALLGWSFCIRSCLWASICAPKGSVCLWFVQFWRGRTSETTAHTLLEIWVTGWSETTTSTPLPYHFVLCWGDLFALNNVCGYQYALLKGQCVYGLYSFGGAEQVRPLHTPYLKSGSQDEVRPLQAPLTISLCTLLGWSFRIRSEQVRPLQASHLKNGSLTEVRPLQAPPIISPCVCWVMFSH